LEKNLIEKWKNVVKFTLGKKKNWLKKRPKIFRKKQSISSANEKDSKPLFKGR